MTLTVKKAQEIGRSLRSAGLKVQVFTPSHDGAMEMAITTTSRQRRARRTSRRPLRTTRRATSATSTLIVIWPGNVDLQVFPDPQHHQAVLWADEAEHVIRDNEIKLRRDFSNNRKISKAEW